MTGKSLIGPSKWSKIIIDHFFIDQISWRFYIFGNFLQWTGISNEQAEMIYSSDKSNDDVYSRVDTLKSDWNKVVSSFACHAGDPGSIPYQGG